MTTSVQDAVKAMRLTNDTIKLFANNDDIWANFGKSDSNLLRAKLFRLFTEAKMDPDSILWVYMLFAVIKNLQRVKDHVSNLPDEMKNNPIMNKVTNFMDSYLVQYVAQENNKKFAVVHLPTTMPGLDVTLSAILFKESDENLKMIMEKQTFAQLFLDDKTQNINKLAQTLFWNSTVKKTKNQANKQGKEDFKFHEDFYENSVKDKYLVLNADLSEYPPSNPSSGYTEEDIKIWYKKLKNETNKLSNMVESGDKKDKGKVKASGSQSS
jgi:hypothetical protein